jgi:hypothetical protein
MSSKRVLGRVIEIITMTLGAKWMTMYEIRYLLLFALLGVRRARQRLPEHTAIAVVDHHADR